MAVLPDPSRSRAVLIGASTYSHLEDLPAVRNNLSGFYDVLVAPVLGGLPADNCMIVAEPAKPVDVYRTLRLHAAAAEDTLLVYFAGHGRLGDRNELFLCLPDTDPDELPYSAWPYDELRRVVAGSRASKKVVILDCCFSGRALADQAGNEETILGQVGIAGTYLLTATVANAVALAPRGERYTAFTGALVGLLNTGIPDGPELLTFDQIYPRLQHALISRQLPRPRQQGNDTIAYLALARNLAYTGHHATSRDIRDATGEQRAQLDITLAEQRVRTLNERFAAITAQLGHAQPAIRLAGVHAMAGLADDWLENRQTCVDVLCAYLRLPYDPDPGDGATPVERAGYRASGEVRHTIIHLIGAHLRAGAPVSWQGLVFDFRDVVFDGGDFTGAEFSGGLADFEGAVFSGGEVRFDRARFSDGIVNFRDAVFSGGLAGFYDARFSGGTVIFNGARFSGGAIIFANAVFSSGWVYFLDAKLSRGGVYFNNAEFTGSQVGFGGAEFSGGSISFIGATFSGAKVDFGTAKFTGGYSCFSDASFAAGEVDFAHARFLGGEVDFGDARNWSHPPMFSWDGNPPVGVVLPAQPSEERVVLVPTQPPLPGYLTLDSQQDSLEVPRRPLADDHAPLDDPDDEAKL
jgi:hypothetical protein